MINEFSASSLKRLTSAFLCFWKCSMFGPFTEDCWKFLFFFSLIFVMATSLEGEQENYAIGTFLFLLY